MLYFYINKVKVVRVQRNLILGLNFVSVCIILTACNVWNNLLLFLLVGAIPGTSVTVSPLIMLLFVITSTGIAGFFLVHLIEAKQGDKPSLPKKRYGRI